MAWHGRLGLAYRRAEADRTLVHDCHSGPLRVLKSLHDEAGVCQSVLVHPPGGIVGGDTLEIDVTIGSGAHALITTAGATRFYRSLGAAAAQRASIRAETASRIEWLPLESIAYDGCIASNAVRFDLAGTAEALGWDVVALGLPASGEPFRSGSFRQEAEVAGRWLDRGTVCGDQRRLVDSPLGWAGRPVLATAWFAAGRDIDAARRERLVEAARAAIGAGELAGTSGVTAVDSRVVVARALAPSVEPAMAQCVRVWQAWRREAWAMAAPLPRVWRT